MILCIVIYVEKQNGFVATRGEGIGIRGRWLKGTSFQFEGNY